MLIAIMKRQIRGRGSSSRIERHGGRGGNGGDGGGRQRLVDRIRNVDCIRIGRADRVMEWNKVCRFHVANLVFLMRNNEGGQQVGDGRHGSRHDSVARQDSPGSATSRATSGDATHAGRRSTRGASTLIGSECRRCGCRGCGQFGGGMVAGRRIDWRCGKGYRSRFMVFELRCVSKVIWGGAGVMWSRFEASRHLSRGGGKVGRIWGYRSKG